ncbi:putative Small secreted protein [Seiridium unicorne]|uniref:Small secreted protein n=1 Tax=Seiridium unicorne TaxID=138068 RepID=A0ABR2V6B7_9PEZI
MYFSKIAVVLSLAASAFAAPTGDASQKQKRALTFQTYNNFQISDGTAGNALAEAQAAFPVDADLANVSAGDLAIIQAARETAEAAETDGFNDAVDAASGDAATALQNGKIKNKVLKLYLETTGLQIQQAQGDDNQDDIDAEQTKLNTNIALDQKAAGQASQGVSFTGDVQPGN